MMTSDRKDIDAKLRAAFHFTDIHLQANRNGQLTSHQQEQLVADMLPFWKVVGIALLVVLISAVFGTFTVASSSDPVLDVEYIPVAFVVIIVLTVAALGLFYRHRRNVHERIREGRITALEGRLKIIESETGGIGRFQVRKQTFNDLTQDQYDLVLHISETHNRPKVTIYHVPGHYKVLSMEFSQEVEDIE